MNGIQSMGLHCGRWKRKTDRGLSNTAHSCNPQRSKNSCVWKLPVVRLRVTNQNYLSEARNKFYCLDLCGNVVNFVYWKCAWSSSHPIHKYHCPIPYPLTRATNRCHRLLDANLRGIWNASIFTNSIVSDIREIAWATVSTSR